MKPEVFIDTSGFFALLNVNDRHHRQAARIMAAAATDQQRFVTTDYILDETTTLLGARGLQHLRGEFLDDILRSRACGVEWMNASRFDATLSYLKKHGDQKWSFTDCFGFTLMQELGLDRALTTDHHYRQAGFIQLLDKQQKGSEPS